MPTEIQDLDPTDANNVGRWPEGMVGSSINDSGRAMEGYLARWFRDTNGSIAAAGSSNAFTVTSNRTIDALANNLLMTFTANHTITGAATLNLNGLGAKSVKRFNGNALASGDIVSGQPVAVIYKSSPDVWYMMSALAALTGNMFADFAENASPGDPAADTARLYAKDDSGNTILAYRDSAGVESELPPGVIVQRTYAEYTSTSTLSTVLPADSTTPQNTEGTEILSSSITLRKSTNRVRARFSAPTFNVGNATSLGGAAALFIGGTANALQAGRVLNTGGGAIIPLAFEFEHAPGSVGPLTYSVRAGPTTGGDIDLNTTLGSAARTTLILEEIHV
ncbi:MAG TPA: hypothetical protein VGF29_05370 [Hyphomicrobiaceae bacterium]|jgi:hypothetical protein